MSACSQRFARAGQATNGILIPEACLKCLFAWLLDIDPCICPGRAHEAKPRAVPPLEICFHHPLSFSQPHPRHLFVRVRLQFVSLWDLLNYFILSIRNQSFLYRDLASPKLTTSKLIQHCLIEAPSAQSRQSFHVF